MSIPKSEQETTLTWIRDEGKVYASTSDLTVRTKWERLGYAITEHASKGEVVRWTTELTPKHIRFTKGPIKSNRKGIKPTFGRSVGTPAE